MKRTGNDKFKQDLKHLLRTSICLFLLICFCSPSSISATEPVDKKGMECVHEAIKNKQFRSAVEQLCKMADHDCGYSQCLLGIMYEKGLGVKKDVSQSIDWYRKAADKGFADAQFRLGQIYYIGQDVKRDPVEAAKWLNKAAEQGVAEAQYYIGRINLKGDGVPRDVRKAKRWLHLAADRGIADAKVLIAQTPGGKETMSAARKVGRAIKKRHEESLRLYGQTLENTEMSWKGYADIINSLNVVTAASSSR